MDVRRFGRLRASGMSLAEIGRETGCDWRTVRKYLEPEAPTGPPRRAARSHPEKVIAPYAELIDEWLAKEPRLRGTVIHQRLVAEHGFSHSYQRVKMYLAEARGRVNPIAPELHRRFEVLPGAQAQVDWGDEGVIQTPAGPLHVYSFHMTLSYSRDPFCRFATSQDLTSFWDCHVAAFHHFGGVPSSILYDRTKTVVRRHVGRGEEVPLHREALAMASHYGFAIRVAAPYRPQAKGRVERQVDVVRHGVLMGRDFDSLEAMQAGFDDWLPRRRTQVQRTHGEVIAARAELDRACLLPLPASDYHVSEVHLRSVAKDCLVSFESSLYSVPWRSVRRPMRVELRVRGGRLEIRSLAGELLAVHARATSRGAWVVDEAHWEGLPDGRSKPTEPAALSEPRRPEAEFLGARSLAAAVRVAARPLADYQALAVAI